VTDTVHTLFDPELAAALAFLPDALMPPNYPRQN
jgi:hypothetical protein